MSTTVSVNLVDSLSTRDFRQLASFIFEYCGIKMPDAKRSMLEGRLRKRLRATGYPTFSTYCDYLFSDGGLKDEAIFLIDVVTTNKTDFFREPNHFEFMEKTALSSLAKRGISRIRAWSSACSTGAEPYTIAMVLAEAVEKGVVSDFNILATDLSTEVLQKARSGIYSRDLVDPVPPNMRRKYVMPAKNKQRGDVRINAKLRSKIGFARMNLMNPSYDIGDPVHILFCRNVLIYFDKKTQTHVLTELCKCLAPGGYLMIGHSETVAGINLPVTQVANTVFMMQ